jgi:hypothetical protein
VNGYREYPVSVADKQPLVDFILDALRASGCSPIYVSPTNRAPYRITFETADGERVGVLAYIFFANNRETKNRPKDEHRFQVKYASDFSGLHEIAQDPYGLYTTLFFGVNLDQGFFVAADPVLNNPTRFSLSKEFKDHHVAEIHRREWYAWERGQRQDNDEDDDEDRDSIEPKEVLLGALPRHFLRYILFEREARGEDQGHRQLLAEQFGGAQPGPIGGAAEAELPVLSKSHVHVLEREFQLSNDEILDLIDTVPRLKMAVRGWVAEQHLMRQLRELPNVDRCERIPGDGQPDVLFQFRSRPALRIECKNVLRKASKDGLPRMDFMRSRESKTDPCGRFYGAREFDVVAACLHPQTREWSFMLRSTLGMPEHPKCPGKLSQRVVVADGWSADLLEVLEQTSQA